MTKRSAGALLYRERASGLETLLAHPGGPFWAKKDQGAWSIPKGEIAEGEDAASAARREFLEETGIALTGELIALGVFKQPSGKLVTAFAQQRDVDPSSVRSNLCRIEWPPKSGRMIDIPEIDRVAWFPFEAALEKITRGQRPILEALVARLARRGAGET